MEWRLGSGELFPLFLLLLGRDRIWGYCTHGEISLLIIFLAMGLVTVFFCAHCFQLEVILLFLGAGGRAELDRVN